MQPCLRFFLALSGIFPPFKKRMSTWTFGMLMNNQARRLKIYNTIGKMKQKKLTAYFRVIEFKSVIRRFGPAQPKRRQLSIQEAFYGRKKPNDRK